MVITEHYCSADEPKEGPNAIQSNAMITEQEFYVVARDHASVKDAFQAAVETWIELANEMGREERSREQQTHYAY